MEDSLFLLRPAIGKAVFVNGILNTDGKII